MATSDNTVNLEIVLNDKLKKVLEDYSKTTDKLVKVLEKPNKNDSDKELKAAEQRDKTEDKRSVNVDKENKNFEEYRRVTTQMIHENRIEAMNLKLKHEFLVQEKRMKDKMILADKRHMHEMMQRMVSGTLVGKLGAMAVMGAAGAAKGGGMLTGAGKKLAKKSAIMRGLFLEEGSMSKAENQEAAGGIAIGFGDNKAKEVTKKTQGFLRDNKVGQSIVKSMEKSRIFKEKMGAGFQKAKGGLGIAGVGALGIGGSIITKAIESSPIAQSMMKIMSTAFTLILRPIGDFFGGVMKPIALRLLKFGAENVGAGASLFKMGEKVGIAALAMFTDPAAFFGSLVERAFGTLAIALDPLKSEAEKAAAYASMLEGFDTKMEEIAGVAASDMQSLVTQASQQVISGIDNVNKTTTEGFAEIISKTDEAAKKLEEKQNRESGIFGGYGSKEEQQSELERLMAESKAKYGQAWANAEAGKTGARGGKGMEFNDAGTGQGNQWMNAPPRLKEVLETINTGLSDEGVAIIANFEAMKEAGILGNEKQTELREQFAKAVEDGTGLYADIEKRNAAHAKIMQTEKDIQTGKEKEISEVIAKTSEAFGVAYNKVQKMIKMMKRSASGGGYAGGGHKNATGGMITEPVIGIGQHTGETWSFGERGMEYVTPNTSFGGTNNYDQKNNVVINVTIEKVTGNTDLQQIKPIVERALRESHSRRGII